jgi:hypothetical protein
MYFRTPEIPICPVALGQELDIFYPDLGVPHRGIVYRIDWNAAEWKWDVMVAHNSKREGGVSLTTLEQFAHGNRAHILRSPQSPEHLQAILQRADLALSVGVGYLALYENCQHFTTWCYTGKAESPTVQLGVALVGTLLVGTIIANANKPQPRKRRSR